MNRTSVIEGNCLIRVPAGNDDLGEAVSGTDVPVAGVGPTGVAGVEPLVAATLDSRTALFANCTVEGAADVASALSEGTLPTDGAVVVEHDSGRGTLPVPDPNAGSGGGVGGGEGGDPGLAALGVGTRHVLGGCGWRRPADPADHEAVGGFVDAGADEVLGVAADLRGRGWGDRRHDEPVAPDWEAAREADRTAVVVNAHGTAADALLAESAPLEALEGADLAARAVGADGVVVYLSEADERAVERVRAAVESYPDPAAPVEVVTGPSVYRAAEPTMALEAIEGNHRLEARLAPTGAVPTLDGTPALVHTARTYAHLAVALRGETPSTRLVTVSGDVTAPATVELPETATLETALDAVALEGGFKAACVGGRFGGVTDSLDVGVDPDALAGAGLGTEGTVEVLSTGRCVLEFVGERTGFAADTNCGRCVPCREGSKQLTELLRDVYDGDYDDAGIAELVRVMETSSVCEFGVNAGRPARTAVDAFETELRAHADGRCPAGSCMESHL